MKEISSSEEQNNRSLTIGYLFGISGLSIALGIQIIVLPWLVIDHLSLGAAWVGWVQAAVFIPNVLLLLVGGITADKGIGTRGLVPLLLLNILLHVCLAVVLSLHWLNIFLLLSYGFLLGVSHAFIQPWREYLLGKIHNDCLQKMIAQSSLCLYGGQAIGIAIASLMDYVGVAVLVGLQAAFILCAALGFAYVLRLIKARDNSDSDIQRVDSSLPTDSIALSETPVVSSSPLCSGFRDIWSQPALRSLIAIVAFNGFFHIGVFIVALPLLVSEVYNESVSFYSALQFIFVLGTLTATGVIVFKQSLKNPGSRIIFSLLYSGVILLGLSAQPTVAGLFGLIFMWGIVVGIASNMGRAVLQSLAPEKTRGRMISVYQLALFGGAPLGALCAGYLIEFVGVLNVLQLSGVASLVAFGMTLLTRSLWDVAFLQRDKH